MDLKDRKIINSLQEDASLSTREISKKVKLPITTVHNRITKLKASGIIEKYTVDVDHEALDEGFSSYVLISVSLEQLKAKNRTQVDISKDLRKISEVKTVSIVSGGTDIIVFVRTKDVASFDKVLLEKIQMIQGISNTQSLIVIH